jgi:uncharacterized membrane protein
MSNQQLENGKENKSIWRTSDWLLLAVNSAIFAVVYFIFDSRLPAIVGSHFDLHGEINGTMGKTGFWLLYAGLGICLPTLLSFIRYIDPRKQNYARFEGAFHQFRWVIALFLHGMILLSIFRNLDDNLPMSNLMLGGLGLMYVLIGNRLGQLRSNFFIGVRTPWALNDDDNWRLTHQLSARLWVIAGLIMFASAWFTNSVWTLIILLVCTITSGIIPFVYSYLIFSRKSKAK